MWDWKDEEIEQLRKENAKLREELAKVKEERKARELRKRTGRIPELEPVGEDKE